jgi:histidinol-phosphate aminotransferase
VPALPAYNAGLSSQAVRARYGVSEIARLASNENPFGASPAVARALVDLALQVGTYPDANSSALRAAIAQRSGARAEQVVIGNGSEDILQMLCQAFLSPGDRVLTQRPAFGLHEIYPRMMGAQVEALALTPALGFDIDAWCEALARGPKLVMLANPSNPVGCMFDAGEFDRLLAAMPPATLLVLDEAYYEYARTAPGFPDALAAWGDEAFMVDAVAATVKRRDALADALRAMPWPGLRIAPSAANFLFIDLARPNGPVNEALLARGIIVKPWKEPGFETFIRVSIGTPEENARFLGALAEIASSPP